VDDKTTAALRRMSVVSIAEAVSFLVLLIFGSLLSRISDVNLVMPLGMLHGVLFILYVVQLAEVWQKARWSKGEVAFFVLLAVLPTGGFFGDRRIRARRAAAAAVPAEPSADEPADARSGAQA
jgi:integral membrane protein